MNINFERKSGKMKNKLKSQSGESMAEVLITALVVALGALLLVAMVIASRNIIQKSERAYNTYLNERNTEEALSGDHTSDNNPADSGTTFSLMDPDENSGLVLKITTKSDGTTANTVALPSDGLSLSEADLNFHVITEDGEIKLVTYEPKKTSGS